MTSDLRFTLSYRDVEELLAERGLDVSYETVRRWVLKFGPLIARKLRQGRPPERPMAPRRCVTNASAQQQRRNYARDEGRPLGAGSQVQASNHCDEFVRLTLDLRGRQQGMICDQASWLAS